MSVGETSRRAGPYTSDGTTTQYTFAFRVFNATEVSVYKSESDAIDAADIELISGVDFTVSLNTDQETSPGGTITLTQPLPAGLRVSILSNVAPTQTVTITNYDGMQPSILNNIHDKAIILIQQLQERLTRTLVIPVSSSEDSAALLARLLRAQSDAQESAKEAKLYRNEAKSARDDILGEQSTVIAAIEQTGLEQKNIVQAEGDVQAERLEIITQETLVGYGVGGAQQTWALTADAPTGSELTLPNAMTYINGRNHLRLSWNGLVLYPEENYEEMGTKDTASTQFKVLFDMKEGDVIDAWTVPLGRGDVTDAIEEIAVIRDSVAEMSRTVAYRETQNKKV